jgi:hypothetical protein
MQGFKTSVNEKQKKKTGLSNAIYQKSITIRMTAMRAGGN